MASLLHTYSCQFPDLSETFGELGSLASSLCLVQQCKKGKKQQLDSFKQMMVKLDAIANPSKRYGDAQDTHYFEMPRHALYVVHDIEKEW